MSISEFSAALKNKAIKDWFSKDIEGSGASLSSEDRASMPGKLAYTADNVNTLINSTKRYRSAEQTASKTSFLLTKDTLSGLLVSLKGLDPSEPGFSNLLDSTFSKFAANNNGIAVNRREIKVGKDLPAVFFNAISFDGITKLVNNILELTPGELSTQFEKGHVIGINTNLLEITRNRINKDVSSPGVSGKSKFLAELDNVIDYYRRLDYDSANIQPAEQVAVYASVDKEIDKTGKAKYIVEIQPKVKNQRSADEVKATIGSIRRLFSPSNLSEKELLKTIDKLRASVSDPKFQQDLLNLKGSPSFYEMLVIAVGNALTGESKDQKYSLPKTEIASQTTPKADLSGIRKIAKEELEKVQKLKNTLSRAPAIRNKKGQFYSLAALQVLINSMLMEQIGKNMGNGERSDVLNFRTGRFAASANVERLTQSREGAITAFYTYMKNPYATFSEGGAQSSPRTRDPKLLISKSIREIAALKVANRLRAVVI